MKKYVILDSRTPQKCISNLKERGFEIIPLPPFALLDAPVSAHPDMLLFFGEKLICHKEYYEKAHHELELIADLKKLKIELSNECISRKYPSDILFNAAEIGDHIFCRTDHVSEHIRKYARNCKKTLVDVKQGYSKCSICKVSESALITADKGIAKAAKNAGISVLEISPCGVSLQGYDCGFIGGASGSDGSNTYFCGNIAIHPNASQIIDFCNSHGAPAVSLSDEPLYDVGTIFFI